MSTLANIPTQTKPKKIFKIKGGNQELRQRINRIVNQFRKTFVQLTLCGAEKMIYDNLILLEKKMGSEKDMGLCIFQACMRYGKSWIGLILLQCIKHELNPNLKLVQILAPTGSKNNILDGWKEKIEVFAKLDPSWNDLMVIEDEKKLLDPTFIAGMFANSKTLYILPTTYSWIYGDGSHKNPIGPVLLDNFSPDQVMFISDEVHHNLGLFTGGFASPGKGKENDKAVYVTNHFGPTAITRNKIMKFINKSIHIGFSGTGGEAIYYYKMYGTSLHGRIESKQCIDEGSIQKIDNYDYIVTKEWKKRYLEIPSIIDRHYLEQLRKQPQIEKLACPLKVLISVANFYQIDELTEILQNDARCSGLNIERIHTNSPLSKQDENNAHIIIGCKKIIEGCTFNNLILTIQTTEMNSGSSAGNSEKRSAASHQFGARSQNPDTFRYTTTQVVLFKNEKSKCEYEQEPEYRLTDELLTRYNRLDPIYNKFENNRWNYSLLRMLRAFNEQEPTFTVCKEEFPIERADSNYMKDYLNGNRVDVETAYKIYEKYYQQTLDYFKVKFPDLIGEDIKKDPSGKWVYVMDYTSGYQETNPEDKKIINQTIVDTINPLLSGKIVVLDHTNFRTSNAIVTVYPELLDRLVIPQCNREIFSIMKTDPKFGKYVIDSSLSDYIQLENNYNTIYADGCQVLDTIKKEEWVKHIIPKLNTGSIFAITVISKIGQQADDFTGKISTFKDMDIMEKTGYQLRPISINDRTQYEYGNGRHLCTMIFKKN
jgi:hypothetical protein